MQVYLVCSMFISIVMLLIFTHVFIRDLSDVSKRMIGHIRRKYDGSFYKDDRSELLTLIMIILLLVNSIAGNFIITYKFMIGL